MKNLLEYLELTDEFIKEGHTITHFHRPHRTAFGQTQRFAVNLKISNCRKIFFKFSKKFLAFSSDVSSSLKMHFRCSAPRSRKLGEALDNRQKLLFISVVFQNYLHRFHNFIGSYNFFRFL